MYFERTESAEPLPSVKVTVPNGMDGIRATLKIMQRFALENAAAVRQFVQTEITGHLAQKDWAGEVRAVHDFVRDRIRYVKDPVGMELVQTPQATLQLKSGDCDDKSVLAAAMLKSIGHPSRFVAVAFKPGELSHVYVESKIGGRWIALELTEPWEAGRAPPHVGRMVKDV